VRVLGNLFGVCHRAARVLGFERGSGIRCPADAADKEIRTTETFAIPPGWRRRSLHPGFGAVGG